MKSYQSTIHRRHNHHRHHYHIIIVAVISILPAEHRIRRFSVVTARPTALQTRLRCCGFSKEHLSRSFTYLIF